MNYFINHIDREAFKREPLERLGGSYRIVTITYSCLESAINNIGRARGQFNSPDEAVRLARKAQYESQRLHIETASILLELFSSEFRLVIQSAEKCRLTGLDGQLLKNQITFGKVLLNEVQELQSRAVIEKKAAPSYPQAVENFFQYCMCGSKNLTLEWFNLENFITYSRQFGLSGAYVDYSPIEWSCNVYRDMNYAWLYLRDFVFGKDESGNRITELAVKNFGDAKGRLDVADPMLNVKHQAEYESRRLDVECMNQQLSTGRKKLIEAVNKACSKLKRFSLLTQRVLMNNAAFAMCLCNAVCAEQVRLLDIVHREPIFPNAIDEYLQQVQR